MTSPVGALAALAASGTWAFASAKYTVATREVSSTRVNFMRVAVTAPLWIVLAYLVGTRGEILVPRHLLLLAVSTVCAYAFADGLYFAAARRIGVSSALAIASVYPLWAALEGRLVEGEPFGTGRALGTLLCTGGVAAIIKLSDRADESAWQSGGVWLALATSFLWAGNTIAIKTGGVGLGVPTINAVRYSFALGLLGTSVLLERHPGPTRPTGGWLPLVPAILLDCGFGTYCFIYGIAHTDLAVGATLTSLAPLLSLPVAIWLGAERITPAKIAAISATVTGAVLLST